MTEVKAGIEYKINIGDESFLLNHKQYKLLENILNTGSITKAAKSVDVSYRTALNYIDKIESSLGIKIVSTTKGGKGGGGGTDLTPDGFSIIKECKKINAIMELHTDVNEFETIVSSIDESKGVMKVKIGDYLINAPPNKNYEAGEKILTLISYDNIFLMTEPCTSSIRNILKGKIVEMKLENEIIRVKIAVGDLKFFSDITLSAEKELNLTIGKEVYIGFKAMSVATLKL
ncbi:MAG: TOBE domain-containing protein [Methanobrevibacter sp.]|uniref:TOBE domain-containing protein n=1 Tax=Methanobrevibacter sp. TaxID=66852 RepID=UPI0026E069A8|nr:TOBE domain-containing protein [Methanobrevibacter sp.]MDO5847944.1 TOBE domain-containing protein [Methanobrevibacter sp.]